VLITGLSPVTPLGGGLIGLLALWLGLGVWVGRLTGRGYARTLWMEEYSLLRAFISLRATVDFVFPRSGPAALAPKASEAVGHVHGRLLPQLALAVAAIVAIEYCAVRTFAQPYLPAAALMLYLAWTAICAGVVIRACWFTTGRMRHRRDHHRFNLPVPVTLRYDGRRLLALARDLSLGGLRIELPAAVTLPETVQGRLHLPFCAAGFRAKVVGQSDEAGGGRTARLALHWASDEARDAARALLFGNSLQWDVNHWRELQSGPRRGDPQDQRWRFCKLLTATGAIPCIVRRATGERRWRVVAYAPFNDRPILALELDGAGALRGLSVVSYRSYPIGPGAVFVGELAPSGARTLAMPALGAERPAMGAAAA